MFDAPKKEKTSELIMKNGGLEILLNFVEEKGICHLQADDVCWAKLQATSPWTTTTQGVQDVANSNPYPHFHMVIHFILSSSVRFDHRVLDTLST